MDERERERERKREKEREKEMHGNDREGKEIFNPRLDRLNWLYCHN
jgi:hypothetical protein